MGGWLLAEVAERGERETRRGDRKSNFPRESLISLTGMGFNYTRAHRRQIAGLLSDEATFQFSENHFFA
jgi:hypothetical protein